MNETVVHFEQACENFQSPSEAIRSASHHFLVDFINNSQLFPVCHHILRHSQNLTALFHSAVCLRQGALNRWQSLAPQDRVSIKSALLDYAVLHSDNPQAKTVVSALVGGLAVLLKRGWGDMSKEDQSGFFHALEGAFLSQNAPHKSRRVGIQTLTAIVTEFSPTTTTPLGLSWDYHEQCRKSLEANFLKQFFSHAVVLGGTSVLSGAVMDGSDGGVCGACLELLCAILGWDFRPAGVHSRELTSRPMDEKLVINPDESWTAAIFDPRSTEWVFKLLLDMHAQNTKVSEDVGRHARQLLVMLSSVSSDELLKESQGSLLKSSFLGQLLKAVLSWIQPVESAIANARNRNGDEVTDACRAIVALSRTYSAQEIATASQTGNVDSFATIAAFFGGCLNCGGFLQEVEGTWVGDCTSMLLEFWSEMAQPELNPAGRTDQRGGISPLVSQVSEKVFSDVLSAALKQSAEDAFESDEEGPPADVFSVETRLSLIATIGRACAKESTRQLMDLILGKAHALATPMNEKEATVRLEELVALLQIGVCMIADCVEGETATIPPAMAAASAEGMAAQGIDPVQMLSEALLQVASLSLDPQARNVVSPRLMEVSIAVLTRWSDTYLLPSEATTPSLQHAFGGDVQGPAILQRICEIANTGLVTYHGETLLHRHICEKLLPTITRRSELCARLPSCPAWQQLFHAFASQQDSIKQLGDKFHRYIARSLCSVADSIQKSHDRDQYIAQLMSTLARETLAMANSNDLKAQASNSYAVRRVCCILEALRGVAAGTRQAPKCQGATFAVFLALLEPLVKIQNAFRHHPNVTYSLLRLAGELVEAHIVFLQVANARLLCQWVLELLGVYSRHNLGAVSMEASKSLREEHEAEQCRDVRALLILIANLTDRDLLDFGSPGSGGETLNIAEVVLVGLNIVIPLMSSELLKFPKLCNKYFELLSHMLEVYPEHVAGLPQPIFLQLMSTLEFGMSHNDDRVVQCTMEALAGLMQFHSKAKAGGAEGLSKQICGGGESVPVYFLKLLFRLLLVDDQSQGTIESCAGALLSMMLSEPDNYRALCHGVLPSDAAPDIRGTLDKALTELVQFNGKMDPYSRPGRNKFRSNLQKFVSDVRGAMKVH
ncbi:hypothetical protein BSKO_01147 [Bryopsis sp. KO-2023]|nr:hypothetical protein BSKO_01147 [Bryopsis sp. KO-2023]